MFFRSFAKKLADFYGAEAASTSSVPLPSDHLIYRSCGEYIQRDRVSQSRMYEPAGKDGELAVRWHYGPLEFERFESDEMPTPDPNGPLRMVVWQRLYRKDEGRGWNHGTRGMGQRMGGVTVIGDEGYSTRWSQHARRQLKRWFAKRDAQEREVFDTDVETFLAGYAKAEQTQFMKVLFPPIIRDKAKAHGALVRFMVSRRPGGPIDAGLSIIDVPECSSSLHLAAFIGGTAKFDGIGTGLIDEWFRHCRERGLKYADFGHLWSPGEPDEYKGYSRFKAQFDIHLLRFPLPLWRIVGKWGAKWAK